MVMWTRDGWELTGLLTRVAAHIYRVHHGGQACFQMCNMRYLLESPMRRVHDPHWCEGTPGRRGQTSRPRSREQEVAEPDCSPPQFATRLPKMCLEGRFVSALKTCQPRRSADTDWQPFGSQELARGWGGPQQGRRPHPKPCSTSPTGRGSSSPLLPLCAVLSYSVR